MKARIFIGATSAYCAINDGQKALDILLSGGRAAPQSLRETAQEMETKAARLLENASLARRAADQLEANAQQQRKI